MQSERISLAALKPEDLARARQKHMERISAVSPRDLAIARQQHNQKSHVTFSEDSEGSEGRRSAYTPRGMSVFTRARSSIARLARQVTGLSDRSSLSEDSEGPGWLTKAFSSVVLHHHHDEGEQIDELEHQEPPNDADPSFLELLFEVATEIPREAKAMGKVLLAKAKATIDLLSGAESAAVQLDEALLQEARETEMAERAALSAKEAAMLRALQRRLMSWLGKPLACWLFVLSLCLLGAVTRLLVLRFELSAPHPPAHAWWSLMQTWWASAEAASTKDKLLEASDESMCHLTALGLLAFALCVSDDHRSQLLGAIAFGCWSTLQLLAAFFAPRLGAVSSSSLLATRVAIHACVIVSCALCSCMDAARLRSARPQHVVMFEHDHFHSHAPPPPPPPPSTSLAHGGLPVLAGTEHEASDLSSVSELLEDSLEANDAERVGSHEGASGRGQTSHGYRRRLARTLLATVAAVAAVAVVVWRQGRMSRDMSSLAKAALEAQPSTADGVAPFSSPSALRMTLLAMTIMAAWSYGHYTSCFGDAATQEEEDGSGGGTKSTPRRPRGSAKWRRRQTTPRLRRKNTAYE